MPSVPETPIEIPDHAIEDVRNRFIAEVQVNRDLFDAKDVDSVKSDEWTVKRYLLQKKGNLDDATKSMIDSMKWRKTMGVMTLKDEDFPQEYYQCGGIFSYGKAKDGSTMIILRVKINKKITEWVDLFKKFIVHLVEDIDRADHDQHKGITVIFDCAGAGLSNVDIDLLQFIVTILREYFPQLLRAVIVHELPWVLQWVFKLVQTWLPEEQRKMIHCVNKKDLSNFIDDDQLPDFMGGTNTMSYQIVPKGVPRAEDLAPTLGLRQKDVEKLTKHLEPYLKSV